MLVVRLIAITSVMPGFMPGIHALAAGHDKKVEGGKLRFVLLKRLGEAVITADMPDTTLRETLAHCVSA